MREELNIQRHNKDKKLHTERNGEARKNRDCDQRLVFWSFYIRGNKNISDDKIHLRPWELSTQVRWKLTELESRKSKKMSSGLTKYFLKSLWRVSGFKIK